MTELQLQLEWQDFTLSGRLQQPGEFKNKCIATYKVAALRCIPHETVHHVLVEMCYSIRSTCMDHQVYASYLSDQSAVNELNLCMHIPS